MADIELVIKVPEHCLEELKCVELNESNEGAVFHAIKCILNGTPLPKGHNILDENKVVMELVYGNLLKDDVKCGDITRILKDARIIEADKEIELENN